jgi:hypothetical protein
MSREWIFRAFLISDALLTTFVVLAGVLGAIEAAQVAASESPLHVVIEITVLVIWIVALVGLWWFRSWARALYLAVVGVGLLGALLLGGEPRTGLEASLSALCWLVSGVIISLAYWSPLAGTFRHSRQVA